MRPPFLELLFYVGTDRIADAVEILTGARPRPGETRWGAPRAAGLASQRETVAQLDGVVALWSEAERLWGDDVGPRERRGVGRKVYRHFLEVAERLPCAYAAITVELGLDDPATLRSGRPSLAFQDFYLKRECMTPPALSELIKRATGVAYVEQLNEGWYVSMTDVLNPAHVGVPNTQRETLSAELGRMVGMGLRGD